MKESVLDVLIYLFDHYVEQELEIIPNQKDLKSQLNQAGFADIQIDKAINWLEGLAVKKDEFDVGIVHSRSTRVFSSIENEKLDVSSPAIATEFILDLALQHDASIVAFSEAERK